MKDVYQQLVLYPTTIGESISEKKLVMSRYLFTNAT